MVILHLLTCDTEPLGFPHAYSVFISLAGSLHRHAEMRERRRTSDGNQAIGLLGIINEE